MSVSVYLVKVEGRVMILLMGTNATVWQVILGKIVKLVFMFSFNFFATV